jgi:signal transduction histidine kinase
VRLPFRRDRPAASGAAGPDSWLEAERGRILVEESREAVVILDEEDRVVATSRRARESIEGLREGAPLPERLLRGEGGRAPLEVRYGLGDRRERLVYLGRPGDLAAYEELRSGFTAAVSHELRTPLARLLAHLESASLPGSNIDQLVESARAEVRHIGELIDEVLFLSELEGGREVVSLGSIRALPVLERVVEGLRDRAERAGVSVELTCAASLELPLRQRMLEVVARNLVANAVRYAGSGSTCTLSAIELDRLRVLTAADNGVGVPREDLPRLFERFYRGDRSRTSQGTGLGLAIVKHVVGAADGFVEATPTPGGGLTIRCEFPLDGGIRPPASA